MKLWMIALYLSAGTVIHLAQEIPTATVGFSRETYYVSEKDTQAEIEMIYSVRSTEPRNDRGPHEYIRFHIIGGTASTNADFSFPQDQMFFDGGWGTHVRSLYFPVVADGPGEENETVELDFELLYKATTISRGRATLVIFDETVGKVRFATNAFNAIEGQEFEGTLVREGGSKGAIEVSIFSWYNGDPGQIGYHDLDRSPVTASFADGQTESKFRMTFIPDSHVEGPETLRLTLFDERMGAWVTSSETFVTVQDSSIEVSRNGDIIDISWASPCNSCELEKSGDLQNWAKVTAGSTVNEGKVSVRQNTQGPGAFYRLKRGN